MGAKRQATRQQTRGVKKAKLDPVSAKVKEVLDALERDDCEVHSQSFREGLIAAFPLAMGLGSAKDERHSYQEKVGSIVLEILQTAEAKYQESYKVARAAHAAAVEVKSAKEAAVTASEAALEESTKLASDARDTHLSSADAVTEAQKKLDEASSEVENFDATQLEKGKERAEVGSALETELKALKEGTVEDAKEKKSLQSVVNAALNKIGVDKALIQAAPAALSKAVSSRGSFDNTVVEQVEAALQARVNALDEDINNGPAVKESKLASQTAAQEALAAAEAKVAEDQTKSSEADTQVKEAKTALKQAKDALKEQEKAVADLDVKAYYEETYLSNFTEAIAALKFLEDRMSTVPEAETEKVQTSIAMETDNGVVA
eukprot:gnl/MRDRNA2_/MRDRNA2_87411_c0_seq1.p1 gnl/MRDRNA2_/MRDRNA2_87411_c0~~gnl/MRDRNA2_/MRDRNA2_87411_c0_seq1.p1  ORF type:complete len:376 (+),score=129.08 gnl/MRDRNA2_/MRDRNA2_87411_c0_seq1:81-1208(+)